MDTAIEYPLRTQWGDRLFVGPLGEGWYEDEDSPQHRRAMLCASCGIRPTTKITSGTAECHVCWNWRKLDGPAARHWLRATAAFLSNIDVYDATQFFPKCGLTKEEVKQAFDTVWKLHDATKNMVTEHNSEERAEKMIQEIVTFANRGWNKFPIEEAE